MKKIHKKIGAMALAGMVVAGGVAASGGSSHAVSFNPKLPLVVVSKGSMDDLSDYDKCSIKEVQKICKELGISIRAVSNKSSVMDKFISDGKVIKRPRVRNKLLEGSVLYGNDELLKEELIKRKNLKEKVFRCRYDNLDFLFFL